MIDPRKGQRVRSLKTTYGAAFEGVIWDVFAPKLGEPFVIMIDDQNCSHQRYCREIEEIETAQA